MNQTPLPSPAHSSVNSFSSTSQDQGSNKVFTGNELLRLQIRAFIDAAEEVDIDEDTVNDLLKILPELGIEDNGAESDDADGADFDADEDHHDDGDSEDDDVNSNVPHQDTISISALFTPQGHVVVDGDNENVSSEWTKAQIKEMLHHLKERGMFSWIREYVLVRKIPIPKLLLAFGVKLCPELCTRPEKTLLYFLRVVLSRELRLRDKLPQYNTITDAVSLIRKSSRILILTGAGISVSCGIPDFRSKDGLYASLKERGEYNLDDPQQMFDVNYFKENPAVFYSFASQIYPSNFVPSPCHRFIKLMEDNGKLLRNYTQNIDTLETQVGITKVLQCHGSFATASCMLCRRQVPGSEIEASIMQQKVPLCTECNAAPAAVTAQSSKGNSKKKKTSKKKAKGEWDSDVEDESDGPDYPPGIMKPDITFFGEKLTDQFDDCLAYDRLFVDLLLVIGTSLKVSPVAEILSNLPHSVPQILINKTPIKHINPDIVLLGDADGIVEHLCTELEWELPPHVEAPPKAAVSSSSSSSSSSLRPFHRSVHGWQLQVENNSSSSPSSSLLPLSSISSSSTSTSTSSSSSSTSSSSTRLRPPRQNVKKRVSSELDEAVQPRQEQQKPRRVGDSHVWLFKGAEGGKWLGNLQKELAIQTLPLPPPPPSSSSASSTRCSTPGSRSTTSGVETDSASRRSKKLRLH